MSAVAGQHPVVSPARRQRSRVWLRRALWMVLSLSCAVVAATPLAIRVFPEFGPWLADSLRSIIGSRAVTRLEEVEANVEDRWKRLRRAGSEPRSLRELEIVGPASAAPSAERRAALLDPSPVFRPRDVGAMNPRVAAAEDGIWSPVADPALPSAPPLLFATLLHPDRKRPWAEVFVVAVHLPSVRLHAVAGTVEPAATTHAGRHYRRTGQIPEQARARLLAAFNGGFKTQHGRHGMLVEGTTLVDPQPSLCTVVGYEDGTLAIAPWRKIQQKPGLEFLRQTPGCMVENGVLNPLLRDEEVRNWGATLEGRTVIRRSAIGLDAAHQVLFVAVSNDTTARAIADAVQHAGAADVAQLDVNWAFPKFVLFPPDGAGRRHARGLFRGFVFEPAEYVDKPSPRDFFYLVRR